MELLTRREAAVVQELCKNGATDPDIAEALDVALATVKFHMINARRKAGVKTRTGLALWWVRKGQYRYNQEQPPSLLT